MVGAARGARPYNQFFRVANIDVWYLRNLER
jgi:hypothetical protein